MLLVVRAGWDQQFCGRFVVGPSLSLRQMQAQFWQVFGESVCIQQVGRLVCTAVSLSEMLCRPAKSSTALSSFGQDFQSCVLVTNWEATRMTKSEVWVMPGRHEDATNVF